MKLDSIIKSRAVQAGFCGIALATGLFVFRANADQWDKRTILTVNEPIQVTDTVLEPGQYVFKLLDSQSNRHIVQIFNGNQMHLISTVLAIPNYRLQPTGHSQFSFYETPPGVPKAMHAWFYPGDNFGQEFARPKQAALIQTASAAQTNTEETTANRSETEAETPAPAPEPQAETPAPQQETQEMAQATPPPQAPPPAEQPAEQPQSLPKTASPYPLLGLSGLFSLACYGLLRIKRTA